MEGSMPLKEKFELTVPLETRGLEQHAGPQGEALVSGGRKEQGESINLNLFWVLCGKRKAELGKPL